MTVTVTAVADDAQADVVITVDATAGDPPAGSVMELSRSQPGVPTAVIARWVRGPGDETVIYRDPAAPLQTAVFYGVTADGSSVGSSGTVVITSPGCWLTYGPHPQVTVPVELQAWEQDEIAERQTVHRVIGRRDVVVIGDVWDLPAGTLTYLTRTIAQADLITAAHVDHFGPVLLRTQPSSEIVPDSVYWYMPGRITRRRMSGRSPDGRRLVDVGALGSRSYPADITEPLPTLAELATIAPTLETLSIYGATLYDVAVTQP